MKKMILLISIFFSIATIAQTGQIDTTKSKPSPATDSVLTNGRTYISQQLLNYVQGNFKSITIQQYEDFAKLLNNLFDQVNQYYSGELEKKKKR